MLFMSCVCHAFASVYCCRVVTCWERADPMTLVCDAYCVFFTFPCGILGQVWYLIVSFPDLLPSFLLRYIFLLAKYVPWLLPLLPLLKHKECLAHMVAS